MILMGLTLKMIVRMVDFLFKKAFIWDLGLVFCVD